METQTLTVMQNSEHSKLRRYNLCFVLKLTEQFSDKPTRGQSSRGLVNLQTGQFTDWSTRQNVRHKSWTK